MIKEIIYDKLVEQKRKKEQEIIKLKWQKAELEKFIATNKRQQQED
jgi:hypothetical protein